MNELPYKDTKPRGAADFYYAINATFRFILKRLGRDVWIRYLEELARGYYDIVNRQWMDGGLPAVARYWRAFFAAEPGSEVVVEEREKTVEIIVNRCPAMAHLRAGKRVIVKEYCQHCFYLGNARAKAAGMTMRLCGGNGACTHTYTLAQGGESIPAQDMNAIKEAN